MPLIMKQEEKKELIWKLKDSDGNITFVIL